MRRDQSLLVLLALFGCSKGPVNPEPATNSLALLANHDDALPPGSYFSGSFDAQGRSIMFGRGVRRYDPAIGAFESVGTDVGGFGGALAPDGTLYKNGYRFDATTGLWSLLPPISGDPLDTYDATAAQAIGDEGGNLYAIGKTMTLYRLPKGATAWEAVAFPQAIPIGKLFLHPNGHGVIATQGNTGTGTPFAVGPTGGAVAVPGGIVAMGYDADGTGWFFDHDVVKKVGTDGSITQVVTTTNPLGVPIYGAHARDAKGRFFAEVADADSVDSHLLRLNRGDSVWEDLGTLADAFDFIEVRKDGFALDFSSGASGGAWVYEFYGTGDSDLLPDPKEDGVKFTPAAITLHPGQSIRVGLALGGASSLDGLSIAPGAGTKATPKLTLSPHGAAGSLVVSAEETAVAGATQVTVKSPNGASGTLPITIAPVARVEGGHRSSRTMVLGNVGLAVRTDGTVWTWPGAFETFNPTMTASQVAGISSARSVALDLKGYGPAYAVRADGQVWAFNTARPDIHPFLIQGLSHIVAIAAGFDEALFLDDTGHVWSRQAFQNFNGVNPGVPMPVPALDHAVAIGPGFYALKVDGSVTKWDDTVTPPVVQQVQGLGAVTDVGFDFALTADGAFVSTVRSGDAILDNSYTAASAISFSTPITSTQYTHSDVSIGLRSDGTAWDASVYYANSDPFPSRLARQLDTPPHLVGVGTSGYSVAVLTADGKVYQAPLSLGVQQSGGTNTAFIKIPGLDSVLLPPGDAPQPDFDVSGPALSTLTPGASIDVPLTVSRSGGFTGDIAVTGQNPPAGLTVAPLTIPASATTATLHVTAAANVTRFSRLALQLLLTSGSITHSAQISLSTPITGGISHPTFTIGGTHGLAVKTDGTVLAWGSNQDGELGLNTTDTNTHGTAVAVPGLANIVAVAAGSKHSLALDSSGALYAWGDNSSGQLGYSGCGTCLQPKLVPGIPKMSGVAAIGNITLALAQDGSIWQLLAHPVVAAPGPYLGFWLGNYQGGFVAIGAATGDLTVFGSSECGITTDHVVHGAGAPESFLAIRSDLTVIAKQGGACTPSAQPALTNAVNLSLEAIVFSDGTVSTMRTPNSGSSTPSSMTPQAVPGITTAVDVVTSDYSNGTSITGTTAVLLRDGTIAAFGLNNFGQAGAPIATNKIATAPQAIPGVSGVRLP
jgi:alpha-tubulin suppressor-like RCC1 family protein